MDSNSPSIKRLFTTAFVQDSKSAARGTEKQTPRRAVHPSATAFVQGSKSVARRGEKQTHSQTVRPSATDFGPGPKSVGRGAEKHTRRPAARPSASGSWPGPTSALTAADLARIRWWRGALLGWAASLAPDLKPGPEATAEALAKGYAAGR